MKVTVTKVKKCPVMNKKGRNELSTDAVRKHIHENIPMIICTKYMETARQ